jgi:hypothetical protein
MDELTPVEGFVDADVGRLFKILEKYENLDFVKRILYPEKYPVITSDMDKRLKKGQIATHQMSWSQNHPDPDKATEFYVYPNIVNNEGNLDWLDGPDADEYSRNTGERIVFDNREDAEWNEAKEETEDT